MMMRIIATLFLLLNGLQIIKATEVMKHRDLALHEQETVFERRETAHNHIPLDQYEYVDLSNDAFDKKDFQMAAHYFILSAAVGHIENLSFLIELDAETELYLTFKNITEETTQLLSLKIKVEQALTEQSKRFKKY